MKYLLASTAIIITFNHIIAQTFVAPMLGIDFAKVQEGTQDGIEFNVPKSGYSSIGPLLGMAMKTPVSKKLVISSNINFTRKKTAAFAAVFNPIESLKFNIWRAEVLAIRQLTKTLFVGLGPSLNHRGKVRMHYQHGGHDPFIDFKRRDFSLGATLSAGVWFNQIMVEAYFNKQLTAQRLSTEKSNFQPIHVFGLKTAYLFQIGGTEKIYGF